MPTSAEWLKGWQSTSSDHESLLAYLEVFTTSSMIFYKTCDGIFAESIAKGLLSLEGTSGLNTEFCGLLQIVSRHPTPNCRRFLLSMIPALLMRVLELGWFEKDLNSSMLGTVDQTLLVCYEQDLKVRPSPSIRVCPPSKPSIYSSSIKSTSNEFPFDVKETRIDLPSFNQKIKQVNDYNRLVLTARFCQTIQDVFTELPPHTRQIYTDLLLRYGAFLIS